MMAQKKSHPAPAMAKTASSSSRDQQATQKVFADHISELRMRITWVVLVFIVTSAVAYNYRDFLVNLVLAPLGDQKLVYLTPAGGFSFIFQITMYAGAVVTAPLLIYHLYRFVVPALPTHAQRHSLKVVASAIVLMLAGVAFGYFVAVPAALHFLTTFAGTYVEASLTADSYLSFILAYVAGLGVLFQLPLLLVFWNWISPMGPKKLMSSERFVVVFAFIAAAIMTPTPDILNQSLIAVPIIGIYQLGVISVLVANHARARRDRKAIQKQPVVMKEMILDDAIDDLLSDLPELLNEPVPVFKSAYVPTQEIEAIELHPTPRTRPSGSIDGMVSRSPRMVQPSAALARTAQPVQRGAIRPPARAMSLDGFL